MRAIIPLLSLLLLPVTPAAAHRVHDRPHMLRPGHGMQISVGPIAVPQGKEVTDCTYFKLGINHDLAVNRVKIKVRGGSHHITSTARPIATRDVPDGVEVCNMAVNFDEWELVLASQSVLAQLEAPARRRVPLPRAASSCSRRRTSWTTACSRARRTGWALFNLVRRSRSRRSCPMSARSSAKTATSWSRRTARPAPPPGACSRSPST